MYVDKLLLVSDEQDVGAGAGTQVSSDSIDLMVARRMWGNRQLYMIFIIDETFLTSTSIEFEVITDSASGLDDTPTKQISTGAIAIGSLTAGRAPICLPIGSAIGTEERYLGARYTEGGSSSTAGKITAFIAVDPVSQ